MSLAIMYAPVGKQPQEGNNEKSSSDLLRARSGAAAAATRNGRREYVRPRNRRVACRNGSKIADLAEE